jgi:hypothetical protein
MSTGNLDLAALALRMANRAPTRTEANVQSDLHALLLAAPLELEEGDLNPILEQQAGGGRRIDVEAGFCVFEVKRDLRKGRVREDAISQLGDYVASRTRDMQQRYVGVLTDGADWHLYHLLNEQLEEVSHFILDTAKPDIDGLVVWLEGVLATGERIRPTPGEIERRLGASSPAHALDYAELSQLFLSNRNVPGVRLKRELWARLLTTAFGTGFADSDALFIEHTLLVITAEIIAHGVVGIDPTAHDVSAATVLSGRLFAEAQVHGVVEADFFDWLLEVKGGPSFVKALARRLIRFAWRDVEHDVLKVLYESVISTEQRKKLGEYYTPDWLAERVVAETVISPLSQRVLDPACGSGTFLFHAVRLYLIRAQESRIPDKDALQGVTAQIVGMDIHPVAVTFARVTYLLAIGAERLQMQDRPAISIPVYLGDSIQWGQERTLFTANALVVPATNAGELWATELRFPATVVTNAGQFDRLVSELADMAAGSRVPKSPVPPLNAVFRRYAIPSEDQAVVAETFRTLCRLHDEGQDHIWGYYVRNLARPYWLARPENRVDVLVGNPPWLAYRHMTLEMQQAFRELSEERDLWAGASVATNQDLSTVFVLRAIERYLVAGGQFGFVMPWAVLRGRQYAGFRRGSYELRDHVSVSIKFRNSWDLHAVKPSFFPVPACVIVGTRSADSNATPLPEAVVAWEGRLPRPNADWNQAASYIRQRVSTVERAVAFVPHTGSPYQARFSQGATLVPRMLFIVEEKAASPLGMGAGRIAVRSRRSNNEKSPWKNLPALEGSVDRQFVMNVHVGDTLLPFRLMSPHRAVIPAEGSVVLDLLSDRLAHYPGLHDWWRQAESLWVQYRLKSTSLSLREQLDYRRKLSDQLPVMPDNFRVVYNASGMYLAAAIVRDPSIIEKSLYWCTANSLSEARYLEGILNTDTLTKRLRPLQARGEHNPRHYDKYIWQLSIPAYDPDNDLHSRIAALAELAEKVAAAVPLAAGRRFESLRRTVREAVAASEAGRELEEAAAVLLPNPK